MNPRLPPLAFDSSPDHRWLFVFAHPDDEVAIAAWMARLARSDVPCAAIWLHSTATRAEESRRALDLLGWKGSEVRFLDFPDGDLIDHLASLEDCLRKELERFRPTRIATMAFEQGHLDHDSANLVANRLMPGSVVEFPLYYGYWRAFMPLNEFSRPPFETLTLDHGERRLKQDMLRMYPSQTIRRNVLWYGWISRMRGRPSQFDRREIARMQTHEDWFVPNHPERIAERIRASARWQRWLSRAGSYLGR